MMDNLSFEVIDEKKNMINNSKSDCNMQYHWSIISGLWIKCHEISQISVTNLLNSHFGATILKTSNNYSNNFADFMADPQSGIKMYNFWFCNHSHKYEF